jgi:AraC family transcriptional regulator of adaptative response/methylated-DNA-[protein]-cysteine methyltransferase
VLDRDRRAEGVFFLGVKTTGIYCVPGCPSRLPKRENVVFFENTAEARLAGFRACKRCHPDDLDSPDQQQAAILQACTALESAAAQSLPAPALADLAHQAGFSPFHFHRTFKKITGLTPRQYFNEKRTGLVRSQLQEGAPVTTAIYESGFGSSSSFYSNASATLGMKPSEYRRGGEGVNIRYAVVETYLGWVMVAASERGLCSIEFDDRPQPLVDRLHARFPRAVLDPDNAQFHSWLEQVIAFLEAPDRPFNLPVDVQGTAFQHKVWKALQQVPPGSTASYADIARSIGQPKAVRAVAQACASNRVAGIIPCHRIVRSDGALGGYRWGMQRKKLLLERERP